MVKTKLVMIATTMLVLAAAMSAQQAAPAKPASSDQSQNQPSVRTPSQLANIRIELTITDQRTDVQTPPKTVTLLVEDRQSGRIRTGRNNVVLNVDARPEVVRDNRIRVMLSLEYTPQDTDRTSPMSISQTVAALLDDGKPLVVSQSADPSSDRKVKVELKATIVR
jgi:glucose/arabinose dehydrogenase